MPFPIFRVIALAASFSIFSFSVTAHAAGHNVFRVFLDPAHGGTDTGAIGQDVVVEKNIAIKLALAVRAKLSASKNMETVISRTEDVEIRPLERVAMANGAKGSLYLGIHAAGAERTAEHERKIFITPELEAGQPGGGENENWRTVNARYHAQSEAFAMALVKSFKTADPRGKTVVVETDRLFLEGLNMPAAIIEAVDMADPSGAMETADEKNIGKIAGVIAEAIRNFAETAAAR